MKKLNLKNVNVNLLTLMFNCSFALFILLALTKRTDYAHSYSRLAY